MLITYNPDDNNRQITIDFLDVTDDDITAELTAAVTRQERTAVKLRALSHLDIQPDAETAHLTPLQLWLHALSACNGLPFTQPAHPLIVDAIFWTGAHKFLYWLA